MVNDLANMWESFSLTEDEDLEFSIQKIELETRVTRGRACVLGKPISDRTVSRETLQSTFTSLWKLEESIAFKVLGENFFLIDFTDPRDKEWVLRGRPWVFLLVFVHCRGF
jgi:hypothetical protein